MKYEGTNKESILVFFPYKSRKISRIFYDKEKKQANVTFAFWETRLNCILAFHFLIYVMFIFPKNT